MFAIVHGMLVLLPAASGSALVETDVWCAPPAVISTGWPGGLRAADSAWTPVGSLGASTGGEAGLMHTLHELVGAGGGRGDDEDPTASSVGHSLGTDGFV